MTPAATPRPDPLTTGALRWICDPARFDFETTLEVEPVEGVVGQEQAVEALRFGLEVTAPGQNVFVRGLTGTGRSTLISSLLEQIRPDCPEAPDRCYVHNFEAPDRPTLLTLPRGQGSDFRHRIDELVAFVREELAPALSSDMVRGRAAAIDKEASREIEAIGKPFDEELRKAGLALVQAQMGNTTRPVIVPLIEGKPAGPEELEAQREAGKITEQEIEALRDRIDEFSQRLQDLGHRIQAVHRRRRDALQTMFKEEARSLLEGFLQPVREAHADERVLAFLDAVVDDVVDRRLQDLEGDLEFAERYRVNLVQSHEDGDTCPVIVENAPSVQSLVGTIDQSLAAWQGKPLPHLMVSPGSLLRADGGYLVLDARDLLTEPGAWRALIRTLRAGAIEMVPPDQPVPWRVPAVKPEPIPVRVKVVLIGDAEIYYLLDALDADFPHLFKVLADFDDILPREDATLHHYARIVSHIAREEALPPFHRTAIAALCEHGARIAGRGARLSARFGRVADLAREAAFVAHASGQGEVTGDHVRHAVRRTKERASLPARRFRELVANGTIRVQLSGRTVGQVNGLAVIQAGPLVYGFPTRITATIGPGTAGAINIEREAELSGAIHNKSFYILGGLLRRLLRTEHPLAFDASIAFEQSYGGIDGDSASGAEIVCLLSALTDMPIRQDLAMTGAIDQMGNILPIGAVNEKIEGFYDTCMEAMPTGGQGVLIPRANVDDLMLRPDVVEACEAGRFHVWAVDSIHEAMALLLDADPGHRDGGTAYAPDSVLGRAVRCARRYWELAIQGRDGVPGIPGRNESDEDDAT